jgi:hypothetical protein
LRPTDLAEDVSFWFGLALAASGAILAFFAYFIALNVPLTALGLACTILGLSIAFTPSTPVPKLAVKAMLEGSCLNLEALLEEFNVEGKAVYMPPRDERVFAFIPISSNPIQIGPEEAAKAPLRVLTTAGGKPGLIVFPPGSEIVRLAGVAEGLTAEEALNLTLIEFLEGADAVKAVAKGDRVIVEIANPKVSSELPRVTRCLGSLAISVAGCTLAKSLGRPMAFLEEADEGGKVKASFRMV